MHCILRRIRSDIQSLIDLFTANLPPGDWLLATTCSGSTRRWESGTICWTNNSDDTLVLDIRGPASDFDMSRLRFRDSQLMESDLVPWLLQRGSVPKRLKVMWERTAAIYTPSHGGQEREACVGCMHGAVQSGVRPR